KRAPDVLDEAERVGGEHDVEDRVAQHGQVLGVGLQEADCHFLQLREVAGMIELRVGEVDGCDPGAYHREMDRRLTAAACHFQDRLGGNGFFQDLQVTLSRHRRAT